MADKAHRIVMENILCKEKGERTGDDLYIKYEADGGEMHRFPVRDAGKQNVMPGDVWNAYFPIDFDNTAVIYLYDKDVGNDDFLGSHTFTHQEEGKVETITYHARDGRYLMKVEHVR